MVHIYVLNPAHKLRFLSRLLLKGSKRILRQVGAPSPVEEVKQTRKPKINVFHLIKSDLRHVPQEGLTRNPEYYRDESEGGFCVFRVENTLFKVHKCYLLREPSAFGDMFSLPIVEGLPNDAPIPLFDTAEQFQDLLWALYALPSQLASTTEPDSPSLDRLLNVAELANKYCLASYETWALERILALAQNPMGFLRYATPEACARALNLAVLCNHQQLLDVITQRLVARILWTDVDRQPILEVAESRGLRKLQGVAYYKELVAIEKASGYDDNGLTRPVFPPSMSVEKRMLFLAAHHSLSNLWECVRTTAPTFIASGCASHTECLASWTEMWQSAGVASQTMRHGSADVLGRLKAMMILLRKSMKESSSQVTLDCTLAALESITTARDDIVAGLMDHFQGY